MKKILSMLLVFVLLISSMSVTAFAAEVPVERLTRYEGPAMRAGREVYDLGTNGSITLVSTSCVPNDVLRSYYNYKTNSTEINVKLKSNIQVSMRITLHNASTSEQMQQETVTLSSRTKTVSFDGLTSIGTYYVTFENLGQQTVTIEGSITA